MRTLLVLITAAVLSLVFGGGVGCAASPALPAAAPEPIARNAADYNPPSEFDMSFTAATAGTAVKRSEPVEASYRARLVSMEKPSEDANR